MGKAHTEESTTPLEAIMLTVLSIVFFAGIITPMGVGLTLLSLTFVGAWNVVLL